MSKKLGANIQETIHKFNQILNMEENFDIIYRVIEIGGKTSCLYFIDGLNKDEILEKLMEFFYSFPAEEMPERSVRTLRRRLYWRAVSSS
ncbi:MAG: spore germination protein [Lachnospiraceae bacterium]|jgi:stage V sporulation protein AF|nr:spore germination protein [Lachnospiraceae bacterium]